MTLYNSKNGSLAKIEPNKFKFCNGAFAMSTDKNGTATVSNERAEAINISARFLRVDSMTSPRGTATLASNASFTVSSEETTIPFTKVSGSYAYLNNGGVRIAMNGGYTAAGFAMFEEVPEGARCALSLYSDGTQLAQAITTAHGGYCSMSVGPIALNETGNPTFYLKAKVGGGTAKIGNGSDAHQKAAVTAWT